MCGPIPLRFRGWNEEVHVGVGRPGVVLDLAVRGVLSVLRGRKSPCEFEIGHGMARASLPTPMITRPSVREALRAQLRPLPKNSARDARKIVLLHGERGSGRSLVLDSLRAELDGGTAVAWLDVENPQYRGVPAKLTVLAEQLAGRAKGRESLSLPRLLVGLVALRAGEDTRSESKRPGVEQSVVLGGEQIEKALEGIRRVSRWGRVVSETITWPVGRATPWASRYRSSCWATAMVESWRRPGALRVSPTSPGNPWSPELGSRSAHGFRFFEIA